MRPAIGNFGTLQGRRDNGSVSDDNGNERWYKNNVLHRDDGPAIVYTNGHEEWYQNGLRHRLDGPAIIFSDLKWTAWFVNGKKCGNTKEFQTHSNMSDEDITLLVLKYGEIR